MSSRISALNVATTVGDADLTVIVQDSDNKRLNFALIKEYAVGNNSVVDDSAFGSGWNGVVSISASKNALYDWGHTFDTNDNGKVDVLDQAAGIPVTNANGALQTPITDNHSNWDSAYTDRLKWDGGTTGLNATNGRTSLGLVIGTNVQAWDADLDTWATKTAPSGTVVGTTDTQTLTNKRVNPRVDLSTAANTNVWTPNADTTDIFGIAGPLSVNVTTIGNPSGTPVDGQKLIIRVLADSNIHGLNWTGNQWRNSTELPFPAVLAASKSLYLGVIYSSTGPNWDLIAKSGNF